MPTITDSIVVDAPASKIWDLLADMEAPTRYSPAVSRVRRIGDIRDGIGAERHCDLVDGGFFRERVVGWSPNREIAMEIYEANGPLDVATGTFTMTPRADGRTDLTCRMEYRLGMGPLGAVMAATVAKRQFRRMVAGLLAGIKAATERTAGSSTAAA